MGRPYTGFDKVSGGKRAGFETLMDLLEAHFGLWNNGTYNNRNKRGKGSKSVHATGRAGDLSWRGAPYRGPGNYDAALKMMDFLAENADALDIEAIFDYYPQPYGRGWKCDRAAWSVYSRRAFSGAPGGDWVHVEIGNKYADDPQYYVDTFKDLLGDAPTEVKVTSSAPAPSAPAGKSPWLTKGSKGDEVKEMQAIVGADPVDGDFGPKTEAAVRQWQATHDQHVDGIWGPGSAGHAAESCDHEANPPADGADPDNQDALVYPGTPLKRGSKGDDVKLVQAAVSTTQDGDFGPVTERHVKNWQKAHGEYVDGIVGPKTWKAMFG